MKVLLRLHVGKTVLSDQLGILISFSVTMAKIILSYFSMKLYCSRHCLLLASKMMFVVTPCSCEANSFKNELVYLVILFQNISVSEIHVYI